MQTEGKPCLSGAASIAGTHEGCAECEGRGIIGPVQHAARYALRLFAVNEAQPMRDIETIHSAPGFGQYRLKVGDKTASIFWEEMQ